MRLRAPYLPLPLLLSMVLHYCCSPCSSVQSDANCDKMKWSAFRGSWRQEVGDVQAAVTVNQAAHADFFHTASIAQRVVDMDTKLDAQVTHDFADGSTQVAASLLTKGGVRLASSIDRNFKVGCIEASTTFNDLPISRQLGDRLAISSSIDVNERELTLEVSQDIGKNNVIIPTATVNTDGAVQNFRLGWMSKLNNGDAVLAQVEPESAKLNVRYDRACNDGSSWRINCNVPSLTADNALGSSSWSVTRAWSK